MRDSGDEYPLHQPEHNEHHHPLEGQATPSPEQERPTGPLEQRPLHQREIASSPQLPGGRLRKTLIAGVIIGFLCAAQGIVIVLANAALYQSASAMPLAKLTVNTALTIVGIQALISLISVLICLAGGFVVGKIVVQRRLGFLAGFIAGLIIYSTGFLLNYIPNYPGNRPASGAGNVAGIAGGILLSLIVLLIYGIFAGLISLLGAWFATRRHPYYAG
jgi:hypothetical protein